ncbi:MAG: phage portal protein [Gordonia sp. (in: high G+C Gram-positive bacteria)]|uniref:phage portal protein n=1 Tax=Gordonia sp. (in: high G+C Gram-positive bacteria) TaxID=84139 RepID=UPI003C788AAA
MSFFDRVRTALAAPAAVAGQVRYLSPYDDSNHLLSVVAPDWLPSNGAMTRELAMSVPAVKRARNIICTTIARIPLDAYRGDAALTGTDRPLWLDRTDGPISPYHRMVWTIDDLLFSGWSLWAVKRNTAGQVIAADRVPINAWRIDGANVIYIYPNGVETIADPSSIVLIPASDEGLLAQPGPIRHAADLLNAASTAAANPAAYLDLHQTNGYDMTDDERDRIINSWRSARRGENGGVAFSSAGIEVRELGTFNEHLLLDGRNAAALDIARAMSVPALVLDAATDSSMTYVNAQAKAQDLIDYGLSAFMAPVAARLGLDDVSPRGTSIRFNLDAFTGDGATAGTPDDGGSSTPPAPTETGTNNG